MINHSVHFLVLHERAVLQTRSQSQLPALLLARNAHLEALQAWTLLHTGYSMLYSGQTEEARAQTDEVKDWVMSHAQLQRAACWLSSKTLPFVMFSPQALALCAGNPRVTAGLQLLKAQISLLSGEPVEVGLNAMQATVLSNPHQSTHAWQVSNLKLFLPCRGRRWWWWSWWWGEGDGAGGGGGMGWW